MRYRRLISKSLIIMLISLLILGCTTPGPDTPPEENKEQEEEEKSDQDANTTASTVNDESAFKEAISEEGTWIIIPTKDLSFDEDLEVEGEFRDKDDPSNDLFRKLALYEQDQDKKITKRYTITAPKMIIRSPNTNIKGGVIKGDVYVEAEGFTLSDANIEGNLYFSNEEDKTTFQLQDGAKVTGDTKVQDNGEDNNQNNNKNEG